MSRRYLLPTAIPSVFEGCPSYFTRTEVVPRATSLPPAENRRQAQNDRYEKAAEELFAADRVSTLEELRDKLKNEQIPGNITAVHHENSSTFLSTTVEESGRPKILFSITITDEMTFVMHDVNGDRIDPFNIIHITTEKKIETASEVLNVIAWLKSYTVEQRKCTLSHVIQEFERNLDGVDLDEATRKKLNFLLEQFQLLPYKPRGKRYSVSLLSLCAMWEKTSPALYRQLLAEGLLSLPSARRLKVLTEALTVDLGMSNSAKLYLKARVQKLNDMEKIVSLLIDEVYTNQRVEYSQGKFFGLYESKASKTLLVFMVKGVASKFRDVVALLPVTNLDAQRLQVEERKVLEAMTEIGLEVVNYSADNATANRKFFTLLCGGVLKPFIQHPLFEKRKLFLTFDAVHGFKNILNSFQNRVVLDCPKFDGIDVRADFKHVEMVFKLESGKPIKMAHRLSEKALHPSVIERSNVQHAEAVFHASTVNAMTFYATTSHPEMQPTANFLRLIRRWWDIVNCKTTSLWIKKRNEDHRPASPDFLTNLEFLEKFANWISEFESTVPRQNCLTRETALATRQTCMSLKGLAEYLLFEKKFKYVLLGQAQSDPLEARFSAYRQLSGSNYFVTIKDVLEAEKRIRLKSLLKFSQFSIGEVAEIFKSADETAEAECQLEADELVQQLGEDPLNVTNLSCEDENILYYVSGFVAKSVRKNLKCERCQDLLVSSLKTPTVQFSGEVSDEFVHEKDHFLKQLNRGGLCTPSDLCFVCCVHCWAFLGKIKQCKESFHSFLGLSNSASVFVTSFRLALEAEIETNEIVDVQCDSGHDFQPILNQISRKMFNICGKMIANELNDEIAASKKRKKSSYSTVKERKITKLQSSQNK